MRLLLDSPRWLGLIALCATLAGAPGHAEQTPVRMVRSAASFDRSGFTDPTAADQVHAAGNLRGTRCCVSGWAEYDFAVETSGWHQIWVAGGALEYLVDPPGRLEGEPAAYFAGGSGLSGEPDKVGNVWLERGVHRVRVQTYLWNGFSDFRSIELRRSGDALEGTVSISWPRAGQIFRTGHCPTFDLLSGGRVQAAALAVIVHDRESGAVAGRQTLRLPASAGLVRQHFQVPCDADGYFRASVAEVQDGREREIDARGIKGFDYEVVETRRRTTARDPDVLEPILAIDCASKAPDYESGDSTVVRSAAGNYRQSGDRGWVAFERMPEAERIHASGPSWFAYALPGLTPGRRYRIEIDYPDDDNRTFGIFLREAVQHAYPVSIGVDTGGPYPTSNAIQRTGMTVWPRSTGPRLVFAPAHDGTRAACASIRIARVTPGEPEVSATHAAGTREFVHWYEEGINFIDLFGARGEDPKEVARAIDRWSGSVASEGGTTLMPTVLVYGGQLYPSRYNLMDMYPDKDPLRRIVLSAERFGLRVIPEVHPRADELTYGKDPGAVRKLLLVSKDGSDNYYAADGHARNLPPHYNVLLPQIQEWMVAMIGELADRYRDSPALEGISLRVMQWSNAALDNLVDLNWGYDDETVERFERETGARTPEIDLGDAGRFHKRYVWLTTIGRTAWVDWRCRQISALLKRIAARVQRSRPDLKLYLHVFPSDEGRPYTATDSPRDRLREAGIDVEALAALPGVILIDSSASYGRNLPGAVEHGLLDPLRNASVIDSLRVHGESGWYIATHRYIEATDQVITPKELGFSPSARATWASVAANRVGRSALERFAAELAEGDALMLGDGGNGYVFSVPGLQEFLADYTPLPARGFRDLLHAKTGVVVRALDESNASWAYAVNRERQPRLVEFALSGRGTLVRLASGAILTTKRDRLTFELPSYGIFSVKLSGDLRIVRVSEKAESVPHERRVDLKGLPSTQIDE